MPSHLAILASCAVILGAPVARAQPVRAIAGSGAADLRRELQRLRAENDSLRAVIAGRPAGRGVPSVAPITRAAAFTIPNKPDSAGTGTVEVEYDRFKNQTTATLRIPNVGSGFALTALYSMPGDTPSPPENVVVMLSASSNDWQYLRCYNVDMLVDGRPIQTGKVDHDGRVGRGYVLEFITFELPTADFIKLANASTADLRVCRTEFKLLSPDFRAFRDLASRMK